MWREYKGWMGVAVSFKDWPIGEMSGLAGSRLRSLLVTFKVPSCEQKTLRVNSTSCSAFSSPVSSKGDCISKTCSQTLAIRQTCDEHFLQGEMPFCDEQLAERALSRTSVLQESRSICLLGLWAVNNKVTLVFPDSRQSLSSASDQYLKALVFISIQTFSTTLGRGMNTYPIAD